MFSCTWLRECLRKERREKKRTACMLCTVYCIQVSGLESRLMSSFPFPSFTVTLANRAKHFPPIATAKSANIRSTFHIHCSWQPAACSFTVTIYNIRHPPCHHVRVNFYPSSYTSSYPNPAFIHPLKISLLYLVLSCSQLLHCPIACSS
jgi:hypothetical protein